MSKSESFTVELKILSKETGIYFVGSVVPKVIGFFIIPIFTRVFSREEYGEIEILMSFSNLLGIVITMGVDTALSFYFFSLPEKRKEVISSIIHIKVLIFGLVFLTILMMSRKFVEFMQVEKILIYIFSFYALEQTLIAIFLNVLRLQRRPRNYVIYNTLNSLFSSALAIVLCAKFKLGVYGFATAIFTTSGATLIALILTLRENIIIYPASPDIYKKVIFFGFPLMFSGLSSYLLNFTDRWMLNTFLGKDYVGIYGVGASFSLSFDIFITSFSIAFMPYALEQINKPDINDSVEKLIKFWRYYSGFSFIIFAVFLIFTYFVFDFIVDKKFSEGKYVIPFLTMKSIFFGATYFSSLGTWKMERSYLYSAATIAGGFFNVALNYVFIKAFGIVGASISTAISMLITLILSFTFSEFLFPIKFKFSKSILILCCGILLSVAFLLIDEKWKLTLISVLSIITTSVITFEKKEFSFLKKRLWKNKI